MLKSKQLRRRLTRLVDAICDEADNNAEFLSKLEEALVGTKKVISSSKATLPEQSREDVPELFSVFAERGPQGLKSWLSSFSVEQLREIVRAHRFDPSRLSDKWKSPERFIDLILRRASARSRQGEVFRTYRSADNSTKRENTITIEIEGAQYSREYRAVLIQAALENESNRPDTLKDILLKIGELTYRPTQPPPHLSNDAAVWFQEHSLRFEPWSATRGTWYFGGKYGSNPIDLEDHTTALLIASPVRGAQIEVKTSILPPTSNEGKIQPPNKDEPKQG